MTNTKVVLKRTKNNCSVMGFANMFAMGDGPSFVVVDVKGKKALCAGNVVEALFAHATRNFGPEVEAGAKVVPFADVVLS